VVVLSDELNHASIIDGARLAARAGGQVSLQVCVPLQALTVFLSFVPHSTLLLLVCVPADV
jgi:hypothetical protein